MAAPLSPRRSLGDLMIPGGVVRALGWGMLVLAFSLPSVAWLLGWVRTPEEPETTPDEKLDVPPVRDEAKPAEPLERPEADCPGAPLPTGEKVGPGQTALAKTRAPMDFVRLTGGTFTMGSDRGDNDEKPCHRVELGGFEMALTEVTNEQWELVMGKKPPSNCLGKCPKTAPVTDVSWGDAVDFLNRLSRREGLSKCYAKDMQGRVTWRMSFDCYRLPTEAEWEYAARAGTVGTYSFTGGEEELGTHAWFSEDFSSRAHPVGQLDANEWGLRDVHGNVWEWVWDQYAGYSPDLAMNPAGQDGKGPVTVDDYNSRVLRGGSFYNGPAFLRSANRLRLRPTIRFRGRGLRVARGARPSI